MIEKLTQEQEEQIPLQIEKWIQAAHTPIDRKLAEKAVTQLYERINEPAPRVIFAQSPLQAVLMTFVCRKIEQEPIKLKLWDQLRDQLWDQLRDQLGGQLNKINNDWYMPLGWIETYAGWIEFGKMIGAKLNQEHYDLFLLCAGNLPFLIPYKGICFVSDKPTEIHWNNKRLHRDGGASLKFADGYSMYNLNGVRMEEWMTLKLAEEIDPAEILKVENVEQRRELIRKVGMERFLQKAPHKVLDKQGDYALLSLELSPEIKAARFLKMKNPSVEGVFHVEGVHPTCDTVQESINWRASGDKEKQWKPKVLT